MARTHRPQDSDAAWIVALWHALHGADAAIEDVAAEVTAIFSQYLPGSTRLACPTPLTSCQTLGTPDTNASPQQRVEAERGEDASAFDLAIQQEKLIELSQAVHPQESLDDSGNGLSVHHYYFKFKGRTYRFELPALTCSPAAA
jgi:hypothetical protein